MSPADLLAAAEQLEAEATSEWGGCVARWCALVGRQHWKQRVARLLREQAEKGHE